MVPREAKSCLNWELGPGLVDQLVGVSSQYTKSVGLIPSQGTYKNQLMNESLSETTNFSLSFSLSLSSLSNQLKLKKEKRQVLPSMQYMELQGENVGKKALQTFQEHPSLSWALKGTVLYSLQGCSWNTVAPSMTVMTAREGQKRPPSLWSINIDWCR